MPATPDQLKAIAAADERYAQAVAAGDIGAKRQALRDRIRARTATLPRVDHNGVPVPRTPDPDPTPPGGNAAAA